MEKKVHKISEPEAIEEEEDFELVKPGKRRARSASPHIEQITKQRFLKRILLQKNMYQ